MVNSHSAKDIERLAAKAKLGDRDALLALCHAIVGGVLFKANCIMGNPMDAEDVAQETLIRVCAKIKELNDPKAFKSWLGTIILNEARRQLQKNSRYDALDIDDYIDAETEEGAEYLPHESLVKEENCNSVTEAIALLPKRQREAVVLHYYDEMSVTDTAKMMGISQQTASEYLQLARERIKGVFEGRQSISAMPLGVLSAQALHHEATVFISANEALSRHVLEGSTAYIKNMTLMTAAKSTAALSLGSKIAIILAVVIVASGLGVNYVLGQTEPAAAPAQNAGAKADATGVVVFSGGNAEPSHLNPLHAEPQTDNGDRILTAREWKITTLDGTNVLYNGEGGNADGALAAMQENHEDGEYMMDYYLEDTLGDVYMLQSNFLVRTAAE